MYNSKPEEFLVRVISNFMSSVVFSGGLFNKPAVSNFLILTSISSFSFTIISPIAYIKQKKQEQQNNNKAMILVKDLLHSFEHLIFYSLYQKHPGLAVCNAENVVLSIDHFEFYYKHR